MINTDYKQYQRPLRKRGFFIGLISPLIGILFCWVLLKSNPAYWGHLLSNIPSISAKALEDNVNEFLIIDIRNKKEFEVSHLSGAIQIEDINEIEQHLSKNSPAKKAILYCTIGYRSSILIQQLPEEQKNRVLHLEGGIYEVIQESPKLIVSSAGKPVKEIHPYSPFWALFLPFGNEFSIRY